MTNPKAHAPNATQRSYKAKPIRLGPAEQPARDGSEHWRPGEMPNERAFAPTYDPVRRCWDWSGYSEARHGKVAERQTIRAALDPDWWK